MKLLSNIVSRFKKASDTYIITNNQLLVFIAGFVFGIVAYFSNYDDSVGNILEAGILAVVYSIVFSAFILGPALLLRTKDYTKIFVFFLCGSLFTVIIQCICDFIW
jgi:hypothetical protein